MHFLEKESFFLNVITDEYNKIVIGPPFTIYVITKRIMFDGDNE